MHALVTAALALLMLAAGPSPAAAGPQLIPAAPQPSAAALTQGLAVRYAYPPDVKSLGHAAAALRKDAAAGPPLAGLDYPDTNPGQPALTSRKAEFVAAEITGYLHFDAPGLWRLEFHSNDGLDVTLGQLRIYTRDGRAPCDTGGWVEVTIPEPGWYPLHATFFQRLGTSCLMLRRESPSGVRSWTSAADYGFRPG